MVSRALRCLLVAAFVAVTSCASPTLPLPPPATPSISRVSVDKIRLSSTRGVEPNALVILHNRNPNVSASERVEGVQADGEGSWEETITAFPGDAIDISQVFGSTRSPGITIQVPAAP